MAAPSSPSVVNEDSASYRHNVVIPVRYDDIDSLRHVNNKSYLSFVEDARVTYMQRVFGMDRSLLTVPYVIARLEVDFRAPAYYGDTMTVLTRCARIGTRSFTLHSLVHRRDPEGTEALCARVVSVLVTVDERGASAPNDPAAVRSILEYEPVKPEQIV